MPAFSRIQLLLFSFFLILVCLSCAEQEPKSLPDLYHAGIAAGAQGDLSQAVIFFEQALILAPDNLPTIVNLHIAQDVRDRVIDKKTAQLLYRATHAQNQGDLKRKVQLLTRAMEMAPGYKLIYNERGIAYFELGMFSEAIDDRSSALELDPTYAAAYYNKALACEQALRPAEAVQAYQGFIRYADPQLVRHVAYAKERISLLTPQLSAGKF